MRVILLVLFIQIAGVAHAQYNGNIWCFGDSAGINFNSNSTFTTAVKSRGSCASIADSLNGLLCYAYTRATITGNTTLLFNGQNQPVINGTNIIGQGWYRELTFIPYPGNDSLFYLFCIGVNNSGPPGLFYSIINYKANNGTGIVISKNNQLLNFNSCDGLTAIKHGNGRDWWVFYKKALVSNNQVYRFLITPNAVSNTMIQSIGTTTSTNNELMLFNHKGDKMLITNAGGLIEYFDFNRCSGLLSNPIVIRPENYNPKYEFWYSAFSPNDSICYLSTGNTTSYLYQLKMYANNIWNSRNVIDSFSTINYAGGDLKLAPDGKIYYARAYNDGLNNNYPYPDTTYNMYNMNLSVINSPDSPGVACNFTPFSYYLAGNRTYWGLPNNPDYSMPALAGSICDTITGIQNLLVDVEKTTLQTSYVAAWQKLFVNALNLKGKKVTLKIFDINGREVFNSQNGFYSPLGGKGAFTQDVDCSNLVSGLYLVVLFTEKEKLSSKFVKLD
jgi:hypothetical protein